MTYFVSYELLDADCKTIGSGQVVIKDSSPGEVENDMEAIRNDSHASCIRVLCLTVLSPEVQPL